MTIAQVTIDYGLFAFGLLSPHSHWQFGNILAYISNYYIVKKNKYFFSPSLCLRSFGSAILEILSALWMVYDDIVSTHSWKLRHLVNKSIRAWQYLCHWLLCWRGLEKYWWGSHFRTAMVVVCAEGKMFCRFECIW